MSEGSAVPYVRRYYKALFAAATNLAGVQVRYGAIRNMDEALGSNGRVEVMYWGQATSDVELRVMKATPHVKYREHADSELFVEVAARDFVDDASDIESRVANLLGEVIKVIQTNPSPPSPGTWLHGISCEVRGLDLTTGTVASSGATVYAATYKVTVHIDANVEQ